MNNDDDNIDDNKPLSIKDIKIKDSHALVIQKIVLEGMSNVQAYMSVYPDSKYEAAAVSCNELLKIPKSIQYVDYLRQQRDAEAVLSFTEKREYLAKILRTPIGEIDVNDPLAQEVSLSPDGAMKIKMPSKTDALKIDNAMMGHDAPKKVEIDATLTIGEIIRQFSGKQDDLLPTEQEIQDLNEMKQVTENNDDS